MAVPIEDAQLCRSIVRALQYVVTRLELAYNVNKVCRFMQKPTNGHQNVIKCILRYLRATMDYDIHLKKGSKLSLVGFSYAKWGSYPNDQFPRWQFLLNMPSYTEVQQELYNMLL